MHFCTRSAGRTWESAVTTASLGTARGKVPPIPNIAALNRGDGTKTMS
jgi:hypothetical protein